MTELTTSEKIHLGTKEITKRIREQIRKEFPKCKFSVSKESYSGGSSINIYLLESNFKVIRKFEDISKEALYFYETRSGYKPEIIKLEQEKMMGYQLNKYTCVKEFDENTWNNGVFLTREGHELFRRVNQIVNQYNYDNSDPQTDYFDTNFYLHLGIGKWNKTFVEVI